MTGEKWLVSVCVHFLNLLDTETQKWTQSLTISHYYGTLSIVMNRKKFTVSNTDVWSIWVILGTFLSSFISVFLFGDQNLYSKWSFLEHMPKKLQPNSVYILGVEHTCFKRWPWDFSGSDTWSWSKPWSRQSRKMLPHKLRNQKS